MEIVRYVVAKDYSEDYPAVGGVTVADFYNQNDAIEYYRWKVKGLKGYDVGYKFVIIKRTETIEDDGKRTVYYNPFEIPPNGSNRRGT